MNRSWHPPDQSLDVKQMDVGLAVVVVVDATMVRGVLLAATDEAARRLELVLPALTRMVPTLAHEQKPEQRLRLLGHHSNPTTQAVLRSEAELPQDG